MQEPRPFQTTNSNLRSQSISRPCAQLLAVALLVALTACGGGGSSSDTTLVPSGQNSGGGNGGGTGNTQPPGNNGGQTELKSQFLSKTWSKPTLIDANNGSLVPLAAASESGKISALVGIKYVAGNTWEPRASEFSAAGKPWMASGAKLDMGPDALTFSSIEQPGAMAIATSGTAVAAWAAIDKSGFNHVWFGLAPDGVNWQPPKRLDLSATKQPIHSMSVAVSPIGDIFVSWVSACSVNVAHGSLSSDMLSSPKILTSNCDTSNAYGIANTNKDRHYGLAIDDAGQGVVIALDAKKNSTENFAVVNEYRWSSSASDWSLASSLSTRSTFGSIHAVSVGRSPSGKVAVAWDERTQYGNFGVKVSSYTTTSGWKPASAPHTFVDHDLDTPHVAINDAGQIFLVAQEHKPNGWRYIWANRFTPNGGWSTGKAVFTWGYSAPIVAMDAQGVGMVAFEDLDASNVGTYDLNEAFKYTQVGSALGYGEFYDHNLQVIADGRALLTWRARTSGTGYAVLK